MAKFIDEFIIHSTWLNIETTQDSTPNYRHVKILKRDNQFVRILYQMVPEEKKWIKILDVHSFEEENQ